MKHLHTFKEFLNESMESENAKIRQELVKSKKIKDDDVVFSVDDEKLYQMLNTQFNRQIEVHMLKNGDEYYSLSRIGFERFLDLADSSGFDVDYENSEDSVVYVYESLSGKSDIIENFIKTYADDDTLKFMHMDAEIKDIYKMSRLRKPDFVKKISFEYNKAKKPDVEDFYDSIQESRVNEAVEYSVGDFPIGAEVFIGDEVWKVVKPGVKGEKIIMAPFNADAKRKYISIAIEFDINWLNANITEIDK